MTSSMHPRSGSLIRAREHRFYLENVMLAQKNGSCNHFSRILRFAPPTASPHAGTGLGDRPRVPVGITRHIRTEAVLVDALGDDRPARDSMREVRVEVVNEQPRNMRGTPGGPGESALLGLEHHQRAVADMELDPRAVVIGLRDRA